MRKNAKILYVDDEFINLRIFEINLRKKYNILTAETPIEALDVLARNLDIDVVVSDMQMPGMNGIEFISTAKEKYPEINYYIFSGFELTEEIQNALNSNLIKSYFRKPFNLNEITSEFERVIK